MGVLGRRSEAHVFELKGFTVGLRNYPEGESRFDLNPKMNVQ
jgi:hypothetical protein